MSDTVDAAEITTTIDSTISTSSTVNNWSRPIFRSIISGPDGTGSTARIAILLVILASLVWVSWCVCRNHAIPDLTGLTLYETSIITVLYAPNKISEVLNNIKK